MIVCLFQKRHVLDVAQSSHNVIAFGVVSLVLVAPDLVTDVVVTVVTVFSVVVAIHVALSVVVVRISVKLGLIIIIIIICLVHRPSGTQSRFVAASAGRMEEAIRGRTQRSLFRVVHDPVVGAIGNAILEFLSHVVARVWTKLCTRLSVHDVVGIIRVVRGQFCKVAVYCPIQLA